MPNKESVVCESVIPPSTFQISIVSSSSLAEVSLRAEALLLLLLLLLLLVWLLATRSKARTSIMTLGTVFMAVVGGFRPLPPRLATTVGVPFWLFLAVGAAVVLLSLDDAAVVDGVVATAADTTPLLLSFVVVDDASVFVVVVVALLLLESSPVSNDGCVLLLF